MKYIIGICLGLAAWAASTVAALDLVKPATVCAVSEPAVDSLKIETMHYQDVARTLGCDGRLARRDDYGAIVIETYAWRGDVWPYGTFQGEFVNGVLQATKKTWLRLAISAKKA